ncbi:unnamed protein product, partial [Notodromas monacha]
MHTIIKTPNAPTAVGPYSQAIQAGNMLFVSGQIPIDPATGDVITSSIEDQAHRVMKNVKGLLESAGYSLEHIVKTSLYLTDLADFKAVNDIYASYFTKEYYPCRETIEVKGLALGVNIEIT